ncbi:MAG: hypothetical protein WCJ02_04885 [bacterium]
MINKPIFNDKDNLVEVSYFDDAGHLAINDDGYARQVNKHNSEGLIIEETYLGLSGEPVLFKEGYTRVTYEIDSLGRVIEATYFGLSGEPVLLEEGYARVSYTRDSLGRIIEEAYRGLSDEPILHKEGYAKRKWIFEGDDIYERELRFFGLHDEPVMKEGEGAVRTWKYADGHEIESCTYGLNNEPVLAKQCGYARRVALFTAISPDERVVERLFFGVHGERVTSLLDGSAREFIRNMRQPSEGKEVSDERYFDLEGKPVLLKKCGYARRITLSNHSLHTRRTRTFGVNGAPLSDITSPMTGIEF